MGLAHRFTFSDLTGWTTSGGTHVVSTDNFFQGTGSGLATADANHNLYSYRANAVAAVNLQAKNAFTRIWYYLPAEMPESSTLSFYMYSDGSGGHYVNAQLAARTTGAADYRCTAGWHYTELPVPQSGGTSWNPAAVTGYGIQISGAGAANVAVAMDSLEWWTAADELPTFMFTMDDGSADHATVIAPKLESLGWRGIFSVITSLVGSNANYASLAQLQAMDAAGHLIASHTASHTAWNTLTAAQIEDEIETARAYLLANGLTRGADILCIPYGFSGTQAIADRMFSQCRVVLNTAIMSRHRYNAGDVRSGEANRLPLRDRRLICRGRIYDKYASLPFTTAGIDARITEGPKFYPIMLHKLDGAAGDLTVEEFETACDYLKAKADAGLCRVIADPETWLTGGTFTTPGYVYTGQRIGGLTGTLTLPDVAKVLTTNGAFGVGGTGSTPTFDDAADDAAVTDTATAAERARQMTRIGISI